MNKDKKARTRERAALAAKENEIRVVQSLRKWKRGTIWLGIALMVSIGAVVPFLRGHSLYPYSVSTGKVLVYLSMCLLCVFMYAAGITYSFWSYLRAIRGIHSNSVPAARQLTGK